MKGSIYAAFVWRIRATQLITAIMVFSWLGTVRAQQCAVDSTQISWDTIEWIPGELTFMDSLPLVVGMENVEMKIEIESEAMGSFNRNGSEPYPRIDSGASQLHGTLPDIGVFFDPLENEGTSPVRIKLSFSTPVKCLAFQISDIDAIEDQTKDSVEIFANADSVKPTIRILSEDPTVGTIDFPKVAIVVALGGITGEQQDGTANGGQDNGSVKVHFLGASVDSVIIIFHDNSGVSDPNQRAIGLFGNLTFSKESPLPVELLSYDVGRDENCHPMIQWKTTNEYELAYYMIEYSYDGVNFSNAAVVAPRNTYTGINHYTHVLDRKLNENNYFRLVKVELDGRSEIIGFDAIDGKSCYEFDNINIFPNPVSQNHFYIQIESSAEKTSEISIINHQGKLISQVSYDLSSGANWFKVSSEKLPPGHYFIRFRSAEEVVTRKINIIH